VKLSKDLREFIALLNSHGVDYVVVGGHAVAFHGYPRFTGDIDFFVRAEVDNAQKLLSALAAFGFAGLGIALEDFSTPEQIIQLGQPPNRIDLLTTISGVSFVEAWQTRVFATIDELPVAFLGKDALLRNKRASGRRKDLADVESLE